MKIYTETYNNPSNCADIHPSLSYAERCIGDYCDIIGDFKVDFAFGEYGKPFATAIKLPNSDFVGELPKFSLSHSGGLILCAVSDSEVGLDIQLKDCDIENCKKIARRFFHQEEIILLDFYSDAGEYIDTFFKIWVRKEAFIKLTGKGLSQGLKTFSVAKDGQLPDSINGTIYGVLPKILGYETTFCQWENG